jgi:hypothetical protein
MKLDIMSKTLGKTINRMSQEPAMLFRDLSINGTQMGHTTSDRDDSCHRREGADILLRRLPFEGQ